MRYFTVDGMLSGTGIRDTYEGNFLNPNCLELSEELKQRIAKWVKAYEAEHFNGYRNKLVNDSLDQEGREIAAAIREEMPESKMLYYSDAYMRQEMIH